MVSRLSLLAFSLVCLWAPDLCAQCDTDTCSSGIDYTPAEPPLSSGQGGSGTGTGPAKPNPRLINYSSQSLQKSNATSVTNTVAKLSPFDVSSELTANGDVTLLYSATGLLPEAQASCQPDPTVMNLVHTEPVAGSGEFLLTETDFTLPGYGIDFVFHRYYRSGVSGGSQLGRGWGHSYRQLVLPSTGVADAPRTTSPCSAPKEVDRFVVSEALERRRFAHRPALSTATRQVFVDPEDVGIELARDDGNTAEPWSLHRKGESVTSFFDGKGNLVRMTDRLGHSMSIAMQNGVVSKVIDTTGRTIYFVSDAKGALVCLSPTNDCTSPYVSFSYHSLTYVDENGQTMRYLVAVTDAEKRTYRTYSYWHQNEDPAPTFKSSQYSTVPAQQCAHECGMHATDCRNADMCEQIALKQQAQVCTLQCDPGTPPEVNALAGCGKVDPGCASLWQIQRIYKISPDCWRQCTTQCLAKLTPPNGAKWFGRPSDLVGRSITRSTRRPTTRLTAWSSRPHHLAGRRSSTQKAKRASPG